MLRLEDIIFSFSAGKKLLDNSSLSLEGGNIYALMGANGAGKTTLFNLITGFLKPQSGSINFNNRKISNLTPFKRNRLGIGRTFQDLRLAAKLSVKENIILAMQNNPTDKWYNSILPQYIFKKDLSYIETVAERLVTNYFLQELENSMATEISYGQQKLLTLACCVANGAQLLLLDEPVAGINPEYCNKIVGLIKQLKSQGHTIFLIEHNTDFIEQVVDKVFFLNEGKITIHDNLEALRKNPVVAQAYT